MYCVRTNYAYVVPFLCILVCIAAYKTITRPTVHAFSKPYLEGTLSYIRSCDNVLTCYVLHLTTQHI